MQELVPQSHEGVLIMDLRANVRELLASRDASPRRYQTGRDELRNGVHVALLEQMRGTGLGSAVG